MSSKRILIIVEGKVTEPRILGNESYGLLSLIDANYDIVVFSNPIYELYEAYKNDEYDDIVSYLRLKKGLKIDKNILSKNYFSAVYLVFDFEPQDHKYSDNKIRDLLNIFDNETELGKLYINYPMVEAYYHLESLPDPNYDNRVIELVGLNGKKYKKLVNLSTCLKKNYITKSDLCYIIMHNYNKAKKIIKSKENVINYQYLLDKQLDIKNKENKIYVLSTFPLITIDYNSERTLNILKTILKDDYIEYR